MNVSVYNHISWDSSKFCSFSLSKFYLLMWNWLYSIGILISSPLVVRINMFSYISSREDSVFTGTCSNKWTGIINISPLQWHDVKLCQERTPWMVFQLVEDLSSWFWFVFFCCFMLLLQGWSVAQVLEKSAGV